MRKVIKPEDDDPSPSTKLAINRQDIDWLSAIFDQKLKEKHEHLLSTHRPYNLCSTTLRQARC